MIARFNSIDGIRSYSNRWNLISSLGGKVPVGFAGAAIPSSTPAPAALPVLAPAPCPRTAIAAAPHQGTWKSSHRNLWWMGWLRPCTCPACFASVCSLIQAPQLPQPSPSFAFLSLYFWIFFFLPFFPSTASCMHHKANNHSRGFSNSTSEIRKIIFSSLFNISPCKMPRFISTLRKMAEY